MINEKSRLTMLYTLGMLWAGLAQAQENAITTGGGARGNGGSVDYSVGQVVYTTAIGSSGIIAQGVQQAYEIFKIGIKKTKMNISISVFPNPTNENLILKINDINNQNISYQLIDVKGKQLNKGQLVAPQTQIDMYSLPNAIYYIVVLNSENKEIQLFKIIKNNKI